MKKLLIHPIGTANQLLGMIYFVAILCSCSNPLGSNSNTQNNFLSSNAGAALNFTDKDNSSLGFGGGSFTGTAWDWANNYVRLSQSGAPTNNSELDSSWTPAWTHLVGYWKLNETSGTSGIGSVVDSSGNGNNGTPNGTVTFGSTGKLNSAATFGSGTNYIDVGTPVSLQITGAVTVGAWLKASSIFSNWPDIVAYDSGGASAAHSYGLFGINGTETVSFAIADGTNFAQPTGVSIADGNWHYIVGVYDPSQAASSRAKLYLDGNLFSTATYNGTALQDTGTFRIGYGNNAQYVGSIDEASVWNTALSAAQVQTIYSRQSATYAGTFQSRVMDGLTSGNTWATLGWTSTLSFFKELSDAGVSESSSNYSSQSNSLMSGIVGLWHLDEVSGTSGTGSVLDRSGNANNGTPTNVAFGASGKLANAAVFNGTSSSINFPNSNGFSSLSAMTLSAWVHPSIIDNTQRAFISGGGDLRFRLYLQFGNVFQSVFGDGTGWNQGGAASLTMPTTGKWYHVVATVDASYARMYVNGVMEGQSITGSPRIIGAPSVNSNIGSVGAGGYFGGALDEVAIWNRALSAVEVLELYRRGTNRIKYQVRSCSDGTCSTNPTWLGPDNTSQTYFSELNNNIVQSDGGDLASSDSVQPILPTMTFSAFGALTIAPNRYFQYRAIMESDDSSTSCNYGSGPTWCSPELQSVSATIH